VTRRVKDGILSITLSRKSGIVLRYNSHEAVSSEEFWADNFFDFA
jgi:alpha-glucosidase